jgi:hypothetical protein
VIRPGFGGRCSFKRSWSMSLCRCSSSLDSPLAPRAAR